MNSAIFLPCNSNQSGILRTTLEQWHADNPSCMVLALVPEAEQDFITALQAGCKQLGMPLVGAVFPALIHNGCFVSSGIWLLRMPSGSVSALIGDLNMDATATAARMVSAIRPQLGASKTTLFMVFDAMVPNISSVLDELYLELGDAVGYLGVNAGSESFQPMNCLFDGERRIGGGVLCLLLPALEAALAHCYQSPDEIISVTASAGNRITHIDWQPAFDVYCTQIKKHYGIDLNRDNFYQHAAHFPFGIALATGDTLVRIPVAVDPDGAIHCVGEVPEYAMLTLLQGPGTGSVDTVDRIAERLGSHVPTDVMLGFYCAGRRMHLGEAAEWELGRLAQKTGETIAGALSLGEIGSLERGAYPHFHNGTLVCANWTPP